MAQDMVLANQRVDFFFAEQVKRLRSAGKSEWEERAAEGPA